ncbi:MAG TPA: T9SS type A sorting domain-containing protein [Rhodothermales bacterium]|nr:T9SS type A sorting domain-containing protein [Rhodothermales bacterium]
MHRLKKGQFLLLCLFLASGLLAEQGMAQIPDKAALSRQAPARTASSQAAEDYSSEMVLDVNNMATWIQRDGFFNWISPYGVFNVDYPKGTAGPVFAQGIVWGGVVDDGTDREVRVGGATYQTGLTPGKILPANGGKVTGADDPNNLAKYHVWRVNKAWKTLDYTAAAAEFYGVPLGDVSDDQRSQLRAWYEYDWNNWPADMGAPFQDNNGDGAYQAATDANGNGVYEPEEGDIPGFPGADQTIWLVTNDLTKAESLYGADPIGLEYQLTLWGYNFPSSAPLGNISFARARLIYRGTPTTPAGTKVDSMYVVQWADADVGDAGDDFAGTDTTLSLGYAYNAGTTDATYAAFGLAPPAVGWDFFKGPVNAEGDTLGMTAFVYFAAGSTINDPELGNYNGSLEWFNLMRGLKPDPKYPAGVPFINPLTGENTKFTLAGDPVTGTGSIDGQELPPGDRRLVLSSGPFTMNLGDTTDVVIGQIGALGTSNLSSVSLLKFYDQSAQFAFDNGFQIPSPPTVPPLSVVEQDEEVVLNWGNDLDEVAKTENFLTTDFKFEGYNVYQLPSASAPITAGVKLASFDVVDNYTVVNDKVFDPETGFVVYKPVLVLKNLGLQRYLAVTQDAIRNRPLANGVTYYFAVTAFGVLKEPDPDAPTSILESTPTVVTAVPQPAKPGVTEAPTPGTGVTVTHTAGVSTDEPIIKTVDATKLVSGNYEIRFGYYNPATGTVADTLGVADTLKTTEGVFEAESWGEGSNLSVGSPFPIRWALFSGDTQVSGWLPEIMPGGPVPETAAPIINGVQIYVPVEILGIASEEFTNNDQRWVTGFTGFGLSGFFGGADVGQNFLGSTLPPDQVKPVLLEFQGDTTAAGGWVGRGKVFVRGATPAYDIAGTGYLPVAAYELNPDGSKGRRLNTSFVEQTGCINMRWDFDMLLDPESDCAVNDYFREYLLIHADDYDEGASYTTPDDHFTNVEYALVPAPRGTHTYLEAPFTITFHPALPPTPVDQYAFSVTAPQAGVDTLLTASVDDINVFPNPYMGFSRLETSRQTKFVTFTHLPEKATIRIFTLAGTMVRTLDHDSPSQFEEWDLTNQDDVPVASGVYFVHVETDNGDKVLKLALVQEEQILPRY